MDLNWKTNLLFDFNNLHGGGSLKGIKIDGDNLFLLILNQESKDSIYQDLWLVKLTKVGKILE